MSNKQAISLTAILILLISFIAASAAAQPPARGDRAFIPAARPVREDLAAASASQDQQNRPQAVQANRQNEDAPVDVYFLFDLTASFSDDIATFQAVAPDTIAALESSYSDIQLGLGRFEDYPIIPFGHNPSGDRAYQRVLDLTADSADLLQAIDRLKVKSGLDVPESQLAAVFQTVTGAGQNLSLAGHPAANIPPGQQANFRDEAQNIILLWTDAPFHEPGDQGAIPYPGPSFAETIDVVNRLSGSKVVGVFSEPQMAPARAASADALRDLRRLARGTGAIALNEGVDCDGDGQIDIDPGAPLVCAIASSGAGIDAAMLALIAAATDTTSFFLPLTFQDYRPVIPPTATATPTPTITPPAIVTVMPTAEATFSSKP